MMVIVEADEAVRRGVPAKPRDKSEHLVNIRIITGFGRFDGAKAVERKSRRSFSPTGKR
jgi:hypothetical protein